MRVVINLYPVVSEFCLVSLAAFCRIDVSKPAEFSFQSIYRFAIASLKACIESRHALYIA